MFPTTTLKSSAAGFPIFGFRDEGSMASQTIDDQRQRLDTSWAGHTTVTELLVRPFQRGPSVVAVAEGFLRHFAELHLIDVTYDVAREAARIRAATGLGTPDALIVASAIASNADVLVTNDRSWPTRLGDEIPGLDVLVLSDLQVAA